MCYIQYIVINERKKKRHRERKYKVKKLNLNENIFMQKDDQGGRKENVAHSHTGLLVAFSQYLPT